MRGEGERVSGGGSRTAGTQCAGWVRSHTRLWHIRDGACNAADSPIQGMATRPKSPRPPLPVASSAPLCPGSCESSKSARLWGGPLLEPAGRYEMMTAAVGSDFWLAMMMNALRSASSILRPKKGTIQAIMVFSTRKKKCWPMAPIMAKMMS